MARIKITGKDIFDMAVRIDGQIRKDVVAISFEADARKHDFIHAKITFLVDEIDIEAEVDPEVTEERL